jgi:hypothetical protein
MRVRRRIHFGWFRRSTVPAHVHYKNIEILLDKVGGEGTPGHGQIEGSDSAHGCSMKEQNGPAWSHTV